MRNRSTQEDTKNGLIRTTEERKYEACCLWFDTVEGIMSAETHTQGLCLSVNVTVRQETILMSKDAEIIRHQSRERLQTQPAVLGGKAGAASSLHVTDATQLSKKKKKPFLFSQIL